VVVVVLVVVVVVVLVVLVVVEVVVLVAAATVVLVVLVLVEVGEFVVGLAVSAGSIGAVAGTVAEQPAASAIANALSARTRRVVILRPYRPRSTERARPSRDRSGPPSGRGLRSRDGCPLG